VPKAPACYHPSLSRRVRVSQKFGGAEKNQNKRSGHVRGKPSTDARWLHARCRRRCPSCASLAACGDVAQLRWRGAGVGLGAGAEAPLISGAFAQQKAFLLEEGFSEDVSPPHPP
jgi:hypothetical protein